MKHRLTTLEAPATSLPLPTLSLTRLASFERLAMMHLRSPADLLTSS
jgi:hypothetical protein